jgi:hypothetical protein
MVWVNDPDLTCELGDVQPNIVERNKHIMEYSRTFINLKTSFCAKDCVLCVTTEKQKHHMWMDVDVGE